VQWEKMFAGRLFWSRCFARLAAWPAPAAALLALAPGFLTLAARLASRRPRRYHG
jgi:hypothetical protein